MYESLYYIYYLLIIIILYYNLILDVWHWYYNLHSRVDSPSVFHYLVHDDQNILECDSSVKVNGLSVNIEHALKIFTPEGLSESYELKSMMNDETAG